jgi:thiamine monophosphate synthase
VTALPPLVVLTDRRQCGGRPLVDVVRDAVDGGARWVVVREKDLPIGRRLALCEQITDIVAPVGGIVSMDRHLSATDPFPELPPTPTPTSAPAPIGRSCHALDELRRAEAEGCAYAFASPVFATASKPGYGPALGRATLAAWCAAIGPRLAVYALGGIDATNAAGCIDCGAAGVAVMGAIMGSRRPDVSTATLIGALTATGVGR